MSFGATDELLVRGVGAARDGQRDDARFYLEWVLRDGPTDAQFIEAWYWLSRITDDPVERRRCLETVLGAAPLHPEARRDLALLDGRLRETDLRAQDETVPPLILNGPLDADDLRPRRCPNCGGALLADPARGGLVCQFCGYRRDGVGAAATEQDWEAAIHTTRGHRWVVPGARALSCQACSAVQTLARGELSAVCAFCGSPQVIEEEAPGDLIAPTGLLPFAFDATAARRLALDWLTDIYDGRTTIETPRPIYLPFWTFDIEGQIRWRGTAEGYWGERRTVEGNEQVHYDDRLVAGGASLPTALLARLTFDTATPAPYTPDSLAGWPAEFYRVPPADASLLAREGVAADYRERLRAVQGRQLDDLTIESVGLMVVSYKLLLVPIWVALYRHDGRDYWLLVNGQSGVIVAEGSRGAIGRFLDWLGYSDG